MKVPVRTIREYQTMGVLPPPERRGRVGLYRTTHVARLELIARLQVRGYSLAGIREPRLGLAAAVDWAGASQVERNAVAQARGQAASGFANLVFRPNTMDEVRTL